MSNNIDDRIAEYEDWLKDEKKQSAHKKDILKRKKAAKDSVDKILGKEVQKGNQKISKKQLIEDVCTFINNSGPYTAAEFWRKGTYALELP